MKPKLLVISPTSKQKRAGASRAAADVYGIKSDFPPSAGEAARLAYLDYENQGSQHGEDVRHWLAAETELSAERHLT